LIIAIGNDHHGFEQKEIIKEQFSISGQIIEWNDVGSFSRERVDYPHYAIEVARAVQNGQAECGILLCGTGVGMSVAANRFNNIYAALVWTEELACKSKEDDNANILVFPSDYVKNEHVVSMVRSWLFAKFKEGRYRQRLDTIDALKGA